MKVDTVKCQRVFGGIFCVLTLAASGFFAFEIHANLANRMFRSG
jgi:hypothetical protein